LPFTPDHEVIGTVVALGTEAKVTSKMKNLSVFIILAIMPYTAYADCVITDNSEKFEIVCSGPDPAFPAETKKKTNKTPRRGKGKKVNYEDRVDAMQEVVMNDVESQFMVTRNKQDGYRGKRKTMEQTSKKDVAGQDRNI